MSDDGTVIAPGSGWPGLLAAWEARSAPTRFGPMVAAGPVRSAAIDRCAADVRGVLAYADETEPPDLPDPTGDVVAEARQVCALLDDPLVCDPGPRFVIQLGLLREALAALDAAAAR